jgi:hypothetical protein
VGGESDSWVREFMDHSIQIAQTHRQLADEAIVEVPNDLMTMPMFENAPTMAGMMVHVADYMLYWLSPEDVATARFPSAPAQPTEESIMHGYRKEVQAHWNNGWEFFISALCETTATELQTKVHRGDQTLPLVAVIEQTLAHVGFYVGQIVLLSSICRDSQWSRESG